MAILRRFAVIFHKWLLLLQIVCDPFRYEDFLICASALGVITFWGCQKKTCRRAGYFEDFSQA
jgi:hypothetical protein